jgi:hypothetical protein
VSGLRGMLLTRCQHDCHGRVPPEIPSLGCQLRRIAQNIRGTTRRAQTIPRSYVFGMDGHKYIERFAIVKESTILFDNVRLLLLLLQIDSLSSQEVSPDLTTQWSDAEHFGILTPANCHCHYLHTFCCR